MTQESRIGSVSLRGGIALLITVTACAIAGCEIAAPEWFQSLALLTAGYYFGQKTT